MPANEVVTRIAPSPTGFMHIGTARTALFNWLYARGRRGKFLLRIEDTDRARSTPEATEAILAGMRWLGFDWDGDAVSQFERRARHVAVADAMLETGAAYKCFSTQEEIEAFREAARADGRSTVFRSPWRDADPATYPGAPFVVRVKAPQHGETTVEDAVQGRVSVKNAELDDMIILRSDGTPTYMLAVVVDDHDMGVTHVIRGDDHLSNTPRQMMIYNAMGWPVPVWAHIPLIHGDDGKKLSKRHGALGVEDWRAMGYPASAMRNYLARLGWAHGDDEYFTTEQALEWFDLAGIRKAPARLDLKKLNSLSGQHIAAMPEEVLASEIGDFLSATENETLPNGPTGAFLNALPFTRIGAKTFLDIIDKSNFILSERPISMDEKAAAALDNVSHGILSELTPHLQNVTWSREALEALFARFTEDRGIKFGKLAQPLRAALAGRMATPSVYDMMLVLGREESIARLAEAAET